MSSETLYKGLWAVQGKESTHLGVPKDGWEALVAEFQAWRKKHKRPPEAEKAEGAEKAQGAGATQGGSPRAKRGSLRRPV